MRKLLLGSMLLTSMTSFASNQKTFNTPTVELYYNEVHVSWQSFEKQGKGVDLLGDMKFSCDNSYDEVCSMLSTPEREFSRAIGEVKCNPVKYGVMARIGDLKQGFQSFAWELNERIKGNGASLQQQQDWNEYEFQSVPLIIKGWADSILIPSDHNPNNARLEEKYISSITCE